MLRLLRSWWWKILLGLLALVVVIQFIPYSYDNPKTRDEPKWDSAQTRDLVVRACAACHSNETKSLWFEGVAPVKWYIANHVKEGRSALNFSEWHTAAGENADEAAETVSDGSMPPSYYTYFGLHSEAKLTPAETKALIDGLNRTIASDPPKGGGD
ncbi:MAG: heme-binding domain-containing protein [Microthrixaceae bacterium]